MICLTLPTPTSTNRLYKRVGPRVFKSKEYRAWIKEAGWSLKAQKPGSIKGAVELEYTFGKSRKDIDNCVKAANDLLVRHRVIEDDSPKFVRDTKLSIDESITGVRVVIRPSGSALEALHG